MKLKICITISIIIICSFVVIAQSTKQNSSKSNLFTVGTVGNYAPWVSVNPQGEYEGFDIDVIRAVATQMGKNLVLKDLGCMTSLFMALEQGKIDAIIWGMSITADRLEKIAMIRYQGETVTSFPLIFWDTIATSIKTIDDMAGMTVCVEPASSQDTVLSAYPFVNKKYTEKVDDALLDIQYGKAAAALVEPAIAKKFISKYPQIKTLNVPLKQEQIVQGVGICIKKNNKELINYVQQAVDILGKNGTIEEYQTKWNIQ